MKKKLITSIKIIAVLWLISSLAAFLLSSDTTGANVAIIPIHGYITTVPEGGFSTSTSSDIIVQQLDKADDNPAIKAIILDINSGGGSGVAADEIGQKIKSINKTTVAVIRDVGASAAYWIASTSDYIFANRLSLTGSIGVTGSYLEFSGLLEDYNVTYQRYVSGELKDMGSPFKEPSEREREVFEQIIDKMMQLFVEEVKENRGLSDEQVNNVSAGQVILGIEALDLELIDQLGTKEDAVAYIEQRLNITAETVEYRQTRSFTDLFSDFKIGKFINPAYMNFELR